mgnify:FL=1
MIVYIRLHTRTCVSILRASTYIHVSTQCREHRSLLHLQLLSFDCDLIGSLVFTDENRKQRDRTSTPEILQRMKAYSKQTNQGYLNSLVWCRRRQKLEQEAQAREAEIQAFQRQHWQEMKGAAARNRAALLVGFAGVVEELVCF